jgi:superoxide dismutase
MKLKYSTKVYASVKQQSSKFTSQRQNVDTFYKTGIHSLIVMKINMMRKDFNQKISNKHCFRITKSMPKSNGKQAKRRVKSQFKKEFVSLDKNTGNRLGCNIKTIDDYLNRIIMKRLTKSMYVA